MKSLCSYFNKRVVVLVMVLVGLLFHIASFTPDTPITFFFHRSCCVGGGGRVPELELDIRNEETLGILIYSTINVAETNIPVAVLIIIRQAICM